MHNKNVDNVIIKDCNNTESTFALSQTVLQFKPRRSHVLTQIESGG